MTSEGDWVLDPFIGVGTTAIAALMHNRRAIGSEIVSDYIRIANERIAKAIKGELRIRPMERNVYNPDIPDDNIPPKFVKLERTSSQLSLFENVIQGKTNENSL